MGEIIQFSPDGEPFYGFTTQLGDMHATRFNSTLFLHDFEHAGVDHLFIALSEDEDNFHGVFLWRAMMNKIIDPEFFPQLASELQGQEWDTLICDTPSEPDQANFDRWVDGQVVKVTNKKIKRWLNETETDAA